MAITSFRSQGDTTVPPTINNPRASRSMLLANFLDSVFDKRYLHGKRNIELLFSRLCVFKGEGLSGKEVLLALFIL